MPETASSHVSFFRTLPEERQIVRVFDLKGCYGVCGDHAVSIAQQFCRARDAIKPVGGVSTVTLNKRLFDQILKEYLVERGQYGIELYEESYGQWSLQKSGSPGDMDDFEEELLRMGHVLDVPTVMALVLGYKEGQRSVGLAVVNKAAREIGVNEFVDDEGFRNVESMFVQLGIKECILPAGYATADIETLQAIARNCQVMLVERPRMNFSSKNTLEELKAICKDTSIDIHRFTLDQPLIKSAVAGLMTYYTLGDVKYSIHVQSAGSFMRLNQPAQKALNVFPSRSDEPAVHSLYGLLNRCKTPMGKRTLKTWIRQPLVDLAQIGIRLDVVEAFVNDQSLREDLPVLLRGMPDVARYTRKLESKRIELSDLSHLYRFSRKLHPILSRLDQYAGAQRLLFQQRYSDPLSKLTDEEHLRRFEKFWEVAIDASKLPDEYLLAPRFDDNLKDVSIQMTDCETRICLAGKRICQDLDLIWEKTGKLVWYKSNNSQKRCMKISCKDEPALRRRLQSKYTVFETLKDGTKFTNRELNRAAEELQGLKSQYEELQKDLMKQVHEISATFHTVFEDAAALVAELDVLCSFALATVTAPIPYSRPAVCASDCGTLSIKGGRHPLVEDQGGVQFVKNDCCMTLGESWFQFITGPNMGGKSTFIRQVGVIVLMAQIGCFVPCNEAIVPIRDGIFARVGAGDCQQHGVSTFMAEMLDTTSIFHGATSRSLVIIDELGRGTSTCDGLGLAWSISQHLMSWIGCPTLFATHFHELTKIQHKIGVENQHVAAEIDAKSGRLCLSFKVVAGPCDTSFGIHVARSAGFPQSVIQLAGKQLRILEGRSSE